MKLCFAASAGGHLEELMVLRPIMEEHDAFVVTEYPGYDLNLGVRTHYLHHVNRHEILCIPKLLANAVRSAAILASERPEAVICTGVLACVPLCLLAKAAGVRLVYIESIAKVHSATQTGRLLSIFADRVYVQWASMLDVYPDAVYVGGIY